MINNRLSLSWVGLGKNLEKCHLDEEQNTAKQPRGKNGSLMGQKKVSGWEWGEGGQ